MSFGRSSESGKSSQLMDLLEAHRKEISVEIDTPDRVLNPFSTIKVRIKKRGEVLYEEETILKCDSFAGCHMCFSRDYSMITFEKGTRKLSFRASWSCLTWEGRPVFEDRYFDKVFAGDLFVGVRGNYIYFSRYKTLEVFKGEGLYRVVIDEHKEFFTEEFETGYEYEGPKKG